MVNVTGLRSTKGDVVACLTRHEDTFPDCAGGEGAHRLTAPAGEARSLSFPRVAPGRYAVALLHDENGNGKADRALLMMPREGFGFSRDAKVRMGPPRFEAAAFEVGAAPVRQTIRMRYMF